MHDTLHTSALHSTEYAACCRRETKINIIGSIAFIAYILALGFYLWVRITKTLDLGPYLWYGCLILAIEMLGATTVILYGLNLVSPTHAFTPAGHVCGTSPPARMPTITEAEMLAVVLCWYANRLHAHAQRAAPLSMPLCILQVRDPVLTTYHMAAGDDPANPGNVRTRWPYHIRVCVPCYKESLEILRRTIMAAYDATLPAGCARTIYLCDDGKASLLLNFQ